MKKVIAASVMAMALATGASAEVKVGLGYTLADTEAINGLFAQPANIRVPIDFDFGLRIEPELGFGSTVNDDPQNDKETRTTKTLAVGGYYNLWNVEKVNFYAGGRLSYTSGEREIKDNVGTNATYTQDTTDIGVQGLFGAEYMFTEDFSIAAQAGLEIVSGTETDSRAGRKDVDTSSVGTVGHVLIHYFF